ncbi:DUF3515 domain-containing protein [Sciscionella sediminilitoris]|uniref:DUF3515 domain-containing protein n=1 Tax=Sciscionella sediminilitoris TaxID=1445613 RepID=UPI0004DF0D73|nr:DUF3515 domain-containing protein [Sciscionella sp. SE31]
MRTDSTGIPKPAIVLAAILGAALLAGVIVLRVYSGNEPAQPQHNKIDKPLAVAPVPAPDAGNKDCAALLGKLPRTIPSDGKQLSRLALAKPAPPATVAWAATEDPVILRCGIEKPAELTPTSQLTVVSGVQWLRVADQGRATYYAVDRPVYIALTVPDSVGTGPLQDTSTAIRTALPQKPVRP